MRLSIRNRDREYTRRMDTGFGSGKPWPLAYSPITKNKHTIIFNFVNKNPSFDESKKG
jgi:hypothetical protein